MTNIKHMGIVYEPVALGSIDSLNISIHAKALMFMITLQTPIKVGIQGECGSIKTSFINNIYYNYNQRD